jgi:hypothetical protein
MNFASLVLTIHLLEVYEIFASLSFPPLMPFILPFSLLSAATSSPPFSLAKFFDLSPEDEAEVKALKLTLYLNLASCYIKLENWDQVRRSC